MGPSSLTRSNPERRVFWYPPSPPAGRRFHGGWRVWEGEPEFLSPVADRVEWTPPEYRPPQLGATVTIQTGRPSPSYWPDGPRGSAVPYSSQCTLWTWLAVAPFAPTLDLLRNGCLGAALQISTGFPAESPGILCAPPPLRLDESVVWRIHYKRTCHTGSHPPCCWKGYRGRSVAT